MKIQMTKQTMQKTLLFGLFFLLGTVFIQAQTLQNDIVFQSTRDGNNEIYSMKADGSNQTNLTNSAESESFPDWSPDGSRIVFGRTSGIWIMNADGSNKTQLPNTAGTDRRPAWSPNSGKIAFERVGAVGTDIYVMNTDGSNQTRLTTAAVNTEANVSPEWSPDSSKIVFDSNRSATGGDQEIYVMNADGSNQTALTDNAFIDNLPDLSPDGSKIAFQTNRNGSFDIYTMNTNGSLQTRITSQSGNDFFVSWSSDSTKFAFNSDRDGSNQIYTMNADGSNQVKLTSAGSNTSPSWNLRRGTINPVVAHAVFNDFFGTGRSDYVLPNVDSDGQTHFDILRNPLTTPAQIRHAYFGMFNQQTGEGDLPLPGDYDGDLKADAAVWRPSSPANPNQAYFYVQPSSSANPNAFYGVPWGLPTDSPATGDYDGDGKNDFTVVRQEGANLSWYILPSGGGNYRRIVFGLTDDFPILDGHGEDFNGDGREDLIVIRVDETGSLTFYVGDALTGNLILAQQWGNTEAAQGGSLFVFYGNYLGDSRADVGVYYGKCRSNPSCEFDGTFWFKETGSSNYTATKFGIPFDNRTGEGDFPMDGDFDGDGKLDITVYRYENTTFYSLLSSSGQVQAQYFDGNSAAPPSKVRNQVENATARREKSIPAGAFKGVIITKQPDGTYKIERMIDRKLKNQ